MLHYRKLTNTMELAWSDRPVPWKCNGLVIRGDDGAVLVDCNFSGDEIDGLMERTGGRIAAYFVTHMHIDHVNNLHNWEKHGIDILCPVPEDGYLRDFTKLLDASGSSSFGTNGIMLAFTRKTQGFREIEMARGFIPGEPFSFGNISVATVHLPGHSPGHTGFIITDTNAPDEKSVLFASDIGLDDFGAWYGFAYCDLGEYRRSITLLKNIYMEGDYILAGSHNEPVMEKADDSVFDAITEKMDRTAERLLDAVREKGPVSLNDLVLTGLFYNLASMGKMNDGMRALYRFWEYHTLKNHAEELAGQGLIVMGDEGILEIAMGDERALA